MAEVNEAALQEELQGLESGETEAGETEETPTEQEQVEMLEAMAGDQKIQLPLNAELPIKHNGQIVKTPLEKVLNAWRQMSHVEDKFKQLNTEREQFQQKMSEFENFDELRNKYSAIQDWSEKNPEQWEQLYDMFQNRDKYLLQQGENNQVADTINALRQEIDDLKGFKSEYQKQQELRQEQEDTQMVQKEIEDFTKEFPQIDLGEKDLDGISLKARILKHGIDNNYPDFQSAALTYLRPQLLETLKSEGRNEAVKGVQKDKKAGVIARSSTPFNGQGDEINPLSMDDESRADKAKAELAQLLSSQ